MQPSAAAINHEDADAVRKQLQRLTSLLAEGVALSDPRMPKGFCDLCLRTEITALVQADVGVRSFVLSLIEQHGGITALLSKSQTALKAIFASAHKYRKAKKPTLGHMSPQMMSVRGKAPVPPSFLAAAEAASKLGT